MKTAKVLLDYGAIPDGSYYEERLGCMATDIIYKKGLCPLVVAAECGNTEACRLLIEYGADVYGDRVSNERPLSAALKNGHEDTANFLREEMKKQKSNPSNDRRRQEEFERIQRQNQKTLQNASENSSDLGEYYEPEVVSHSDHSDIYRSIANTNLHFNQ